MKLNYTNSELTKFMDDYFYQRPQLPRPQKHMLGYMVQSEIIPVMEFMLQKHIRKRVNLPNALENKS